MTHTTTDAAEARALNMATAPKDGTMLRLLVDYTDGGAPLEDEHPRAWTIGFNSQDDTGEDEWKFAGWCWTHDHFTQGSGTPVGWLPWLNASHEVFPQRIGRLSLGERLSDGQDRQCAGGCEQSIPAGHAVYWPDRVGEYPDDIDPSCISCAIAQAESDQGWCECQAFATAEAASGAGEREEWQEKADEIAYACQVVRQSSVSAADRDSILQDAAAHLRFVASLPPATDPAMVTVPRALLAPFAALADEWDRWQAKGSTSTPNMVRMSYGRVRFGLSEYQAVRAALAAAPTIPATGHAATEKTLSDVLDEARISLRVTDACLECNADDVQRWHDTIAWLESLA